ncbi:Uncharacterised protein [Mycobacteroides abscessus subsp. abscessus]|nr:Uncharacterised protein [Mycobacteroides abscessus subsp. abscessus]
MQHIERQDDVERIERHTLSGRIRDNIERGEAYEIQPLRFGLLLSGHHKGPADIGDVVFHRAGRQAAQRMNHRPRQITSARTDFKNAQRSRRGGVHGQPGERPADQVAVCSEIAVHDALFGNGPIQTVIPARRDDLIAGNPPTQDVVISPDALVE